MFKSDTACSLTVYFEVQDGQLAAFKTLGLSSIEATREESGCLYYGYAFDGNVACGREGYVNADAVLAHVENVNGKVGRALAISKITRLEVHAPASEIEKLRGPLTALGPTFYTLEPGGIRRFYETSAFKADTACSVAAYFEVQEGQLAAFKTLGLNTFIERTRKESGCLYYGYAFNSNIAYSGEGFVNADAVLAHFENINGTIGQALAISKIVSVEVHAPAAEIEKLRGPLNVLGPTFYTLEPGGIRRFS